MSGGLLAALAVAVGAGLLIAYVTGATVAAFLLGPVAVIVAIARNLEATLCDGRYEAGVLTTIESLTGHLATHHPRLAGGERDQGEACVPGERVRERAAGTFEDCGQHHRHRGAVGMVIEGRGARPEPFARGVLHNPLGRDAPEQQRGVR